jgi:hypothetical protein
MTALLALRAGAIALVGAVAAASLSDGLCLFAACTGMACPGCGMTRAAGRLVSGDIAGSIAFHPLLLPAVVVAGVWGVEAALARRRGIAPRVGPRLAVALAIATAAVWVVRALFGSLPPV